MCNNQTLLQCKWTPGKQASILEELKSSSLLHYTARIILCDSLQIIISWLIALVHQQCSTMSKSYTLKLVRLHCRNCDHNSRHIQIKFTPWGDKAGWRDLILTGKSCQRWRECLLWLLQCFLCALWKCHDCLCRVLNTASRWSIQYLVLINSAM